MLLGACVTGKISCTIAFIAAAETERLLLTVYYPMSAYPRYRTELRFLDRVVIAWEKTPIFQGREASLFLEGATKVALIGKTPQKRHLAERLLGMRQHPSGLLDAP
jgi:hypothetical protein